MCHLYMRDDEEKVKRGTEEEAESVSEDSLPEMLDEKEDDEDDMAFGGVEEDEKAWE